MTECGRVRPGGREGPEAAESATRIVAYVAALLTVRRIAAGRGRQRAAKSGFGKASWARKRKFTR